MGKERKRSWLSIELEYRAFRLCAAIARSLSLKGAYALAGVVSGLLYQLDVKHRERAITHVLHSGARATREEAAKLVRENFRHMAKVFVEIAKIDQCIGPGSYKERLGLAIGDPEARGILDGKPRQVIVVTAHLGNWELAGSAYCWQGGVKMTSIMRPLNNPKIGAYVYGHRTNSAHRTVSKEKGIRPLLAAIKEGDTLAIVADQHASCTEGVETTFFGQPVRTHATPALLHLKTGLPLWPCFMIRRDDEFHFDFSSDGLIERKPSGDKDADVLAITQMINDAIEKQVRLHPEQWLWAHRRWLNINRKKYVPKEDAAP